MTCPFNVDNNGHQRACSGNCQLNLNGTCAFSHIAKQLYKSNEKK